MDPLSIVGKAVLQKTVVQASCRAAYGMSPKTYLKKRMQLIIDTYDEHHKITKKFVDSFQHNVAWEDIVEVAENAGVIPSGIFGLATSEIKNSKNKFEEFFSCPTYDFVVNYYYYTEELGKQISQTEIDSFVNLARQALRTI